MNRAWLLSISVAALSAVQLAPAQAVAIYDARFTGVVASTQGSTGYSVGNAVTGQFIYNGYSKTYAVFTVAGVSAAAPFASSATLTPDRFSAIYQSQVSPVQQGGTTNRTFTVDLEGLAAWPVAFGDAQGVLGLGAALTSNLDTVNNPLSQFPSTFSYNLSQANGTVTGRLVANLTSLSVAVPEPGSLVLLASAGLALMGVRRRRI